MRLFPLSAPAWPPNTSIDLGRGSRLDLRDAGADRRTRETCGSSNGRDAAVAKRLGFCRGPEPQETLVEEGPENFHFFGDDLDLRHTAKESQSAKTPKLFTHRP